MSLIKGMSKKFRGMKTTIRLVIFTLVVAGLAVTAVFAGKTVKNDSKIGMEFQGGTSVQMKVQFPRGIKTDAQKEQFFETASGLIEERVNGLGIKSANVEHSGSEGIITVSLSGEDTDTINLIKEITSPNLISFRDIYGKEIMGHNDLRTDTPAKAEQSTDPADGGKPVVSVQTAPGYDFQKRIKGTALEKKDPKKPFEAKMVIWVDYNLLFLKAQAVSTTPVTNLYAWCKSSTYTTIQKVNGPPVTTYKALRAECQGHLISDPVVADELINGGTHSSSFQIDGGWKPGEMGDAKNFASKINNGVFEFKAEVTSPSKVSAVYGKKALDQAILVGAIALAVIAVFMIWFYRLLGVISALSLAMYTVLTLFIYTTIKGEYGPDTIAALIIGIGMAIDANIITFEKFKDEIYSGKSPQKANKVANKKTLWTILDSNITTFIAGYVLFMLGKSTVKGFSMMLIISIFLTIVVTVILTRIICTLIIHSDIVGKYKWMAPVKQKYVPTYESEEPQKPIGFKRFNLFSKTATIIGLASGLIVLVGSILALTIKPNPSIEFSGGSRINVSLTEAQKNKYSIDSVAKDLSAKNELDVAFSSKDYYIEKSQDHDQTIYTYVFKTKKTIGKPANLFSSPTLKKIFAGTNKKLDKNISVSTVSPDQARKLIKNASLAILFAILGIIVYIAIRFTMAFAIPAIIALAHDALWVLAIFTMVRIEVDVTFITALLAIVGYSINDTVVTFSSIRRNYKRNVLASRDSIKEITNKSIRQVMTRSLMTAGTTLLVVTIMIIFGPSATRMFSLAMMLGLIAGTYSSIFIATRIWYHLEIATIEFKKKMAAKKVQKGILEAKVMDRKPWPIEQTIKGIND